LIRCVQSKELADIKWYILLTEALLRMLISLEAGITTMENTMNNAFKQYLSELIGKSVTDQCVAIDIATHVCVLAPQINAPSFIEGTKKAWEEYQEQPMLEHYGQSDVIKECSYE